MIGTRLGLGIGGPSPASGLSLLTGLLAWYRNNGTDTSGNGNTLSATGSPTTGNGIDGTAGAALSLDGSSSWDLAAPLIPDGPLSVSWWLKSADPAPTLPATWGQGRNGHADYFGFALSHGLGGSLDVGGSFVEGGSGVTGNVTANAWHHLVLTNDLMTTSLYIDGSPIDTTSEVPSFDVGDTFSWGSDPAAALNGYTGLMQFLGVWNRVLIQADVTALYASGVGFDPTA